MSGQSDNPLQSKIIRVATNLQVIEHHLRGSGGNQAICDVLKESYTTLLEEVPGHFRGEVMTSHQQSIEELIPKLLSASQHQQKREEESFPVATSALAVSDRETISNGYDSESYDSDGYDSDEYNADDMHDALEFSDLKVRTAMRLQVFADRINDCIENAPSDLDYRLVFDQCDVCSLFIFARCDFARNKISVLTLEKLSIAFLELLADRATASTYAKNVVMQVLKKKQENDTKKLEQSVVDANLFGQTPSQALQMLDKAAESKKTGDDEDDDEEERNPYHEAADSAAKEAGSKKKWFDLARFSQKTLLQLRRCILQKVICVVMQLTCFGKVAERVIASRPFLDEYMPNWQDKKLMCDQAFDESIGPLLQNDATMAAACELVWGIATQFASTELNDNFEKAASLPLNQQFEGCDIDQCLKNFQALGVKSYFSKRQSKLTAARTILVPVAFTAAIQRIQDGYDLSRCVYGVNCLAPSWFYRGKKYKLLYDEMDKLIQRKYEHKTEIMTLINNLCGECDAALEVFQNDYLVMDLTADIKNNTDKSLRRLNQYLNLCLQGTSDVDGRDIEAVPI